MMSCFENYPYYIPHTEVGLIAADSQNDGYSIALVWNKAYQAPNTYTLGYNIYYSTNKEDLFSEGPKYLHLNGTAVILLDFVPGDSYYFAVRATQFSSSWINPSLLPDSGDSKTYPESGLSQDLGINDASIFLTDINEFPNYGVIKIGGELIKYNNKDLLTNSLTGLTRGFLSTTPRIHTIDGYDGYDNLDPFVKFFKGLEEKNQKIMFETNGFTYPNYAYTEADGYKYVDKDILNTNLAASDSQLVNSPSFDFVGWRRINPSDLLSGKCVPSYFGGVHYCADGYDGVGRRLKGMSVNDETFRREELLLEQTGKPAVLLKYNYTGVRCSCFKSPNEYAVDRCPKCYGTGFVIGYQQFFNSRRSDGRILVRFDATEEDLPVQEAGIENTLSPNAWTLSYPAVKDRDIIIFYDSYNTSQEDSRFEVLNVTRNLLLFGVQGAQKMRLQRIRKTDVAYKIPVFADSSTMPSTLTSSISSSPGILPHTHTIQISENILSIGQINQLSGMGGANNQQQHNHPIINGVVQPVLGHTHTIIL